MTDIVIGNIAFVGPSQEVHRITLDGYRLPNMTAIPQQDGTLALCLDERFLIEGTPEECAKWLWFAANAMAIGSGYSSFGENSVKNPNPFKVGMSRITLPMTLDLVKNEE